MPNGLGLSKIPRLWREAARRKRACSLGLCALLAGRASTSEGPARRPKVSGVLPGGSAEGPAKGPALSAGVISQGRRYW